ncbi:MAG: hypothetical protein KatS3mg014_1749 [Actinomycetota bacterium]|nr:MAG: hypothetical protein KatS3mg014_1749 [Actinomycetota bacterium]
MGGPHVDPGSRSHRGGHLLAAFVQLPRLPLRAGSDRDRLPGAHRPRRDRDGCRGGCRRLRRWVPRPERGPRRWDPVARRHGARRWPPGGEPLRDAAVFPLGLLGLPHRRFRCVPVAAGAPGPVPHGRAEALRRVDLRVPARSAGRPRLGPRASVHPGPVPLPSAPPPRHRGPRGSACARLPAVPGVDPGGPCRATVAADPPPRCRGGRRCLDPHRVQECVGDRPRHRGGSPRLALRQALVAGRRRGRGFWHSVGRLRLSGSSRQPRRPSRPSGSAS